jgi:hypothetical protein
MIVRSECRAELERVITDGLSHARCGAISYADGVMEIDARLYTDPGCFDQEVRQEPDDEMRGPILELCDFIEPVVRDEDLATSYRQQRDLKTGVLARVCLGRNEDGIQQFYRWIERNSGRNAEKDSGVIS